MRSTRALALARLLPVFLLAAIDPLQAAKLKMFVTSVQGTGDLGSWVDAGPATGLAAGDAICQARAAAAGLANPTAFRAWLSDASTDAYCRVHNLGSQRAANCAQASLPAAAGPWWRTDGKPFGHKLPELLSPTHEVLTTPRYDEFGAMIPAAYVWTGTNSLGAVHPDNHCLGWTSAGESDRGFLGYSTYSSYHWTYMGYTYCDASRRLYCFESVAGDPIPTYPANRPLAFISDDWGDGDLGAWPEAPGVATGIDAGDEICQTIATAAGLRDPGSFKAWLSDSTTDAKDRFLYGGPWVRLDGLQVAASLAALTDGELDVPINVNEDLAYETNTRSYTGTNPAGTTSNSTCLDWVSGSDVDNATYGSANSVGNSWTDASDVSCDLGASLYCLQDTPLLFFDDFETGTLHAWTSSLPAI